MTRNHHPAPLYQPDQDHGITDAEVDDILLEFDNNPREAIRGLLHDLDVLAQDREQSVSFGYVRGTVWRRKPVAKI